MGYFVQKLITGILLLSYSLVALVPSCDAAANLALGKPYTLVPPPSYPLSAPATDRTSLTDGKYTFGRFWIEKTTVGWWPVPSVEILIDLEKVSVIDGITFNTAHDTSAGVYYPVQIHAFVGPDREHLLYAGDIADQPDNLPGPYRTKRLRLDGIQSKGRFVLLEIVASTSRSVFCDEIEVLEGTHDSGRTGSLSIAAARQLSKRLKWDGIGKKRLKSLIAQSWLPRGERKSLTDKLAKLDQKHTSIASVGDDEAIDSGIFAVRADLLRSKGKGAQLLVESVDPWAKLTPITAATGIAPKLLSLVTPQGGYDHAALLVTSLAPDTRKITVSLAKLPAGSSEISLYHAPFVKSAALEYVADPLVPSGDFSLRPGESAVLFVSAKGYRSGEWNSSLKISSAGVSLSLPVNVKVSKVALPESLSLHAVNWGYLDSGLIRDRKKEAARDLQAHHIDIVVVPPGYLQGANQVSPISFQDFARLESYLKYQQGAAKVLLGIGFGSATRTTVTGKFPFLSRNWQDGFRKWYAGAVLAAGRAGFAESQVYLYPYDEMAGEQIDDFVRLAAWAKKEIPSIKFYATFGEESLKSGKWKKPFPYLDIVQAFDVEMLRDRGQSKAEGWLYDTGGMSKSLSPYGYYRMMSWKAFLRGYTGVGFWAYADIGENGSAWQANERDFAVIYEGKAGSIISSRRWEAWRMGIEDYELLSMYARAKGERAAKELAASVYDHQDDTSLADKARRSILIELSGRQGSQH